MTRPPRLTAGLLARLLPRAMRDEVLGDLAEDHRQMATAAGDAHARRWYRHQAVAMLARLVADRGRRLAGPAALASAGSLLTDLRFGLRRLRRQPGYAGLTTAVIAIAIGANAAILAIASAAFLAPLPYPNADRLGLLSMEFGGVNQGGFSVSYQDAESARDGTDAIGDLALFLDWQNVNLTWNGEPERTPVNFVSPNYFALLGFRPMLGRGFRADENAAGAAPVAVLSHGTWQGRFGASPDAIGERILLNDLPHVVIGVLPPDAHDLSHRFGLRTGVYTPLAQAGPLTGLDLRERRSARYLYGLASLDDGATFTGARDQLSVVADRLAASAPESNEGWTFALRPLDDVFFVDARSSTLMLSAGAALMLALVCTSLAALAQLQVVGRARELAMRQMLGAGAGRVTRLLVVEALILAAGGGGLGLAAASWALGLIGSLEVLAMPAFAQAEVNRVVVLGLVVMTVAVGVALSGPVALGAWRTRSSSPHDAGVRDTGAGARRRRAVLVAAEVALASVLLVGAGLLVASFYRLHHTGLGFDTRHLVTVRLDLRGERYAEPDVLRQTAQRLVDDAGAVPGVREAFLWSPSRLGGGNWVYFLTRPGEFDADPLARVEASRHHIAPGTLGNLGITLLAGRDFDATDAADGPRVAILSESLADRLWPEGAIGRRVETRSGQAGLELEVIGIASDARHRSRVNDPGTDQRDIYVPYAQAPERFLSLQLRLHPEADVASVAAALRDRVRAIDPTLPLYDLATMAQQMRDEESQSRVSATLVAGYAGVALALAVLGLYGLLAHAIRQEQREIGIRLALGASRQAIAGAVIGRGMALVAVGLAAGLVAAFFGARLLAGSLFGLPPRDPVVFAAAAAALLLPAFVACAVPALRASRVDPSDALRS